VATTGGDNWRQKLVAKTYEKAPISATRKTNERVQITVAIVDR
jgi:hypothetical protein